MYLQTEDIASNIDVIRKERSDDNQKCLVYRTQINTCEPQAMANDFYKKFKIKCPLYLKRNGKVLTPQYELPKHTQYQV